MIKKQNNLIIADKFNPHDPIVEIDHSILLKALHEVNSIVKEYMINQKESYGKSSKYFFEKKVNEEALEVTQHIADCLQGGGDNQDVFSEE